MAALVLGKVVVLRFTPLSHLLAHVQLINMAS